MKRILSVVLVASFCLGAVAVTGCGSETATAKEYMEKGDELSKKMSLLTSDAVFDAGSLLAQLGVQVIETGEIDPQTVTDEAADQLETIIANGLKAKAEYEKILDLKGVDDYKAYAEERIKAIESTVLVLNAVQELLDELGDPTNRKSTSDTLANWAKSNLEVAVDAVKAFSSWRSAANIRKEKGLGPEEKVEEEPEPVEEDAPSSAPKN